MKKYIKQNFILLSAVLCGMVIILFSANSIFADDQDAISDPSSVITVSDNTNEEVSDTVSSNSADTVNKSITDVEQDEDHEEEQQVISANGVEKKSENAGAAEKASDPELAGNRQSFPMYRLYNPNSGEHFYTASKGEAVFVRNAGWNYEGIGWYAPDSGTPVYRVYNPNAGDHHYTTNVGEKNHLVSLGWRDEGIKFYSSDNHEERLTRQYNPNARAGSHNYTTNQAEANFLVKAGWRDEGTAWYACAVGRAASTSDLGPTTYYQGKNYSEIYDFYYYTSHNRSAAKYADDDQKAIKYFVENGLYNKQQAKEGVSPNSAVYNKYRTASDAYIRNTDKNLIFANKYSSSTRYLITVNRNTHMVYIYQGSQGKWNKINSFSCGDGAPSTPTVEGKFSIYGHKRYFDSGSVRCFYASMFYGAYYFHSTLYAQTSTPQREVDGRVGMALSHGCVRLKLSNAEWIYNVIPTGTAVVVSRW